MSVQIKMIESIILLIVASIVNFHLSVLLATALKKLGVLRKESEYGPVNAWIRVHAIIIVVALFRWTFTALGRGVLTKYSDKIPTLRKVDKSTIAQTILGAGAFNKILADAVFAHY